MAEANQARGRNRELILGLAFGVVFGFLLQKAGVAKYHILMGVLLLEDFTVAKVMLSAILVGMIGIAMMNWRGLVALQVKPTRYAANIVGGVIFGVGFALLGYCPGTGAAALGQGNLDAVAGIVGLMAGSYLFAVFSAPLGRTIGQWGDRGKLVIPEALHIPRWSAVVGIGLLMLVALALLESFGAR